jgi:hypothetical protein
VCSNVCAGWSQILPWKEAGCRMGVGLKSLVGARCKVVMSQPMAGESWLE